MKRVLIGLCAILTVWGACGQPPEEAKRVFLYSEVDELPQFDKGDILKYIYGNIEYPAEANVQGCIVASFVITDTGRVENVGLEKPLYPELDNQVLDLLRRMPSWTPGKRDGAAVNTRLIIPVDFHIK